MIHNHEVLGKAVEAAVQFTHLYSNLEIYIIQNIYGKILVYVDTEEKQLTAELKERLTGAIDV